MKQRHILRRILPHLCIILSVIMTTLIVIDFFNSAMAFLRGDAFKTLLIVYVVVVIVTAAVFLATNAKRE